MSNDRPKLSAYERNVKTPYGLLGADERALTFALGHCFQQCPKFLQMFLRVIGVKNLRLSRLGSAQIALEVHRKDGFTDIEINIPKLMHIIIEAKIGLKLPNIRQLRKYANELDKSKVPIRKLVMLTYSDNLSTLDKYKLNDKKCSKYLDGFNWANLLNMKFELQKQYPEEHHVGYWLREFFNFLEGEYNMKTYTSEVWIVPVQKKPLWENGWSFYDTHLKGKIYYRSPKDRYTSQMPLYIALRAGGKVSTIQRVLNIEHGINLIDRCSEMINIKSSWPREPHTIWHLSEPIYLSNQIPTGDNYMRARHVFCDVDVLLSSSSVREIAERMKLRRNSI